jgi:cobalt-zinc-cadmium efflux system outer membrane protein
MHARGVLPLSIAAVLMPVLLRAEAPQRPPANVGDLIRLATENNRELSALRQRLPEARGMLRQAGAKPAPTLEFSGTTGRPLATVGEEQYSASYNRTIETGGKRARRIEVAEIGVAVAQAEFDERLRQIAYDIALLYADATAQQQRVQRFERLVALNQESIRLTQARVREGDAAQLETQLLEVDLSRAEAERVTALGQLDAILIQLKQLVGVAPSEQLVLAQPARITVLPDVGELQSRASAERSDVRLARFLEQQGGAEVRLATAQGTPDLTLTANLSRQYSRFDDQLGLSTSGMPVQLRDRDDVITAGVQIPLGTRRRNQGNVEAAGARAAGARLRREYMERQAAAEVAAAARRFTAAQSRLGILESRVLGQSEKNLDVIRQAYQLGQFRLLDVLAEQRRVVENQLNYIDAQAELMKSTAELERAVGGEIR